MIGKRDGPVPSEEADNAGTEVRAADSDEGKDDEDEEFENDGYSGVAKLVMGVPLRR